MPQKSSVCDACHRRKIECYGSPPPCTRCKHRSIPCTFDRPNLTARGTRITSGSHTSNESLSQRIERIEHALSVAQKSSHLCEGFSKPPERTPSVTPRASSYEPHYSSRVSIHFAGQFVGLIGSFTGVPFISASGKAWIEERTGQKESVGKICRIGPDWHASLGQTDPLRQTAKGLGSLHLSGHVSAR
ncbi:uncharacterized protein F5Z01DRAFT_651622 [Emericellopsis atlantica]|uniref:Zn(2)-C6 fungal-type domain-containing protein n=1 Tax=Emericellopsis atlantica TaxID=2614577 RepID=A0A9P7ZPT7_9HYPO|nr:uncharacterized protein F5Z01DRAFT_651622 [Emericellopsis atlantica]KAG9255587.1 hypothetical protein F5Z01DRAFT_651622 [Emericellopsis atlantica]